MEYKVFDNPYQLESSQFMTKTYKSREAWLKARHKGLGGSDSSVIMGLNPYKTNIELYEEKIAPLDIEKANEVNEAMQYGIDAEEPLRKLFELSYPRYNVHYQDYTLLQHKKNKFMQYSPDALLYDIEKDRFGIYEGKTTTISSSSKLWEWQDRIPMMYFAQILHGLYVTGFDFAIVNAELRFRRDTFQKFERQIYVFEREDFLEDIAILEQKGVDFYTNNILKKERPPLLIDI